MVKNLFLVVTFQVLCSTVFSQSFDWVKSLGDAGVTTYDLVSGEDGYLYVSGSFSGNLHLEIQGDVIDVFADATDTFVMKLDESGVILWIKVLHGSGQDEIYGLTIDPEGNLILSGLFFGTVDFDPGIGVHSENPGVDTGNAFFVLKLDNLGNFIWVKTVKVYSGISGLFFGASVETDNLGNIYCAGSYINGTMDFDPGNEVFAMTANSGQSKPFILKLSSAGNFIWVREFETGSTARPISIAIDGASNVYSVGSFYFTADFDPGIDTYVMESNGYYGFYISKLDSSGNFVWAKNLSAFSNADLFSGSITEIDDVGNLTIVAGFYGTTDFDPGPDSVIYTSPIEHANGFILNLDSNGNFNWVKTLDKYDAVVGYTAITQDENRNIYLCGSFTGSLDFNSGVDSCILTSTELSSDVFVTKLDSVGNFVWVKQMSPFGSGRHPSTFDLAITNSGSIVITGRFNGTMDFDPGSGIHYLTTYQTNVGEAFIVKLNGAVALDEKDITNNLFSIYPNPFKSKFQIDGVEDFKERNLTIYDQMGTVVYRKKLIEENIEIEFETCLPGVYYLSFEDDPSQVYKLVKLE